MLFFWVEMYGSTEVGLRDDILRSRLGGCGQHPPPLARSRSVLEPKRSGARRGEAGIQDLFVCLLKKAEQTLDDKAEKLLTQRSSSIEGVPPLTPNQRRFLQQLTSCLMSTPTDYSVPMYGFVRWAITGVGNMMGQSEISVCVSIRHTIISNLGPDNDVMLVTPMKNKPGMYQQAEIVCLLNQCLHLFRTKQVTVDFLQLSVMIRRILKLPPYFPSWSYSFGVAMLAAGYCPIFGGGWVEVGFTIVFAFALGWCTHWGRLKNYESVMLVFMGAVATALPLVINVHLVNINVMAVALSVLMWYLPGLSICTGVADINFGYCMEGVGMLFQALSACFMMAFGMGLGFALVQLASIDTSEVNLSPIYPIPVWTHAFFIWLATSGAIVLKQVNPRNSIPFMLVSTAGFFATTLSQPLLGSYSPVLGGFALELSGLIFNLLTSQPTSPMINIGLLPIVPGSQALNGIFISMEPSNAGHSGGLSASLGFLGGMFLISFCIYIGASFSRFLFYWMRQNEWILRHVRLRTPEETITQLEERYDADINADIRKDDLPV